MDPRPPASAGPQAWRRRRVCSPPALGKSLRRQRPRRAMTSRPGRRASAGRSPLPEGTSWRQGRWPPARRRQRPARQPRSPWVRCPSHWAHTWWPSSARPAPQLQARQRPCQDRRGRKRTFRRCLPPRQVLRSRTTNRRNRRQTRAAQPLVRRPLRQQAPEPKLHRASRHRSRRHRRQVVAAMGRARRNPKGRPGPRRLLQQAAPKCSPYPASPPLQRPRRCHRCHRRKGLGALPPAEAAPPCRTSCS
mmetsp:Transcript_1870/g.5589  ORF Transcript_1870/g.5589 Transcript_1870/m.5589 type:complete len:248 (+) Transcript_1870:81-824(+)